MSAVISPAAAAVMLDVRTVAEMLGCSTRHVYRLSDSGRMSAPVKLGALSRWPADSIREWIGQGCKSVRYVKEGVR